MPNLVTPKTAAMHNEQRNGETHWFEFNFIHIYMNPSVCPFPDGHEGVLCKRNRAETL